MKREYKDKKNIIETPKVSVIIPVYNTENYLRQCLDSLVNQTLQEIEIICVNDGSTDNSLKILYEYEKKDSRFHIISQKNQGPGAARNIGLHRALGKHLIFLDSDDWFESDFLKKMISRAEKTNADVVICKADEYDTTSQKYFSGDWMLKTQYIPSQLFSPLLISEHIFQFTYGMAWDKLYKTDYILNSKLEFPSLNNSEDLVFVFSSLFCAKKISIYPQIFIHHRINRKSSVSNSREKNPDAPYQAFQMVKNILEEKNLMSQFKKSFLNWAMEFLIWHVSNMENTEIQQSYYKKLKKEWFYSLEFEKYPLSYYENKIVYLKYLLVKNFSYSVFAFILKIYKTIMRIFKY